MKIIFVMLWLLSSLCAQDLDSLLENYQKESDLSQKNKR